MLRKIAAPSDGILARLREAKPVVEVRVPFELSREQIDDVERGAEDSDWQPAKDAAKKIAFAEDGAIFGGYAEAQIGGHLTGDEQPAHDAPGGRARLPPTRWRKR